MQGHKQLIVWQKAMDLVVVVYKLTKAFPKTEIYGLGSQIQRAAVSIPSNIAEGHGLKQTQAYARHLAIASCHSGFIPWLLSFKISRGQTEPFRWHVNAVDEFRPLYSGVHTPDVLAGIEYSGSRFSPPES